MTGFFVLDKEKGVTSFSAARAAGRLLLTKKCGHTGTLDPIATGVLPIAIGAATRFIELLPGEKKAYTAKFITGMTTDTLDVTGNVLTRCNSSADCEQINSVLRLFRGEIMQTPPMYSALKKDGVRLYELARRGIETQREQRRITVYRLELTGCENGEFTLEVECSKGTYIRSLIDDIGKSLGCGAVMSDLRRTLSNGFSVSSAHTLGQLEAESDRQSLIIPVDKALSAYEKITVSASQARRFKNGGELSAERLRADLVAGLYRVYSPEGDFCGVGEFDGADSLKVKRVFSNG